MNEEKPFVSDEYTDLIEAKIADAKDSEARFYLQRHLNMYVIARFFKEHPEDIPPVFQKSPKGTKFKDFSKVDDVKIQFHFPDRAKKKFGMVDSSDDM